MCVIKAKGGGQIPPRTERERAPNISVRFSIREGKSGGSGSPGSEKIRREAKAQKQKTGGLRNAKIKSVFPRNLFSQQ